MSDHMTFAAPIESAADARAMAQHWQHWIGGQDLSWGEMAEWAGYFEGLAERFPELHDEFVENGIIGPLTIGVTDAFGERFEVPISQIAGHSSAKVES